MGSDGANEIARIRFMTNRPMKTPQPTTWAKAALLRMEYSLSRSSFLFSLLEWVLLDSLFDFLALRAKGRE